MVVDELNSVVAPSVGCHLELWRWETDAHPGLHLQGPQGLIDDKMRIEDADVVIGIFRTRFGTPTHESGSGTEHELRRAWASWQAGGLPEVMLYFSERKSRPPESSDDAAQQEQLLRFREEIPEQQLYGTYKSVQDFERCVRNGLTAFLQTLTRPVSPAPDVPAASTHAVPIAVRVPGAHVEEAAGASTTDVACAAAVARHPSTSPRAVTYDPLTPMPPVSRSDGRPARARWRDRTAMRAVMIVAAICALAFVATLMLAPAPRDPVRILLAIDTSGSLTNPIRGATGLSGIDAAKSWTPVALQSLGAGDQFGIVTFSTMHREPRWLVRLGPVTLEHKREILTRLASLKANTWGTPLKRSIAWGLEQLQTGRADGTTQALVVVTDGKDHASDNRRVQAAATANATRRVEAIRRGDDETKVLVTDCDFVKEPFKTKCFEVRSEDRLPTVVNGLLGELGLPKADL